jgi:hypothetical protein
MLYNIWLGNPHRSIFKWDELCKHVAALFAPVIRAHSDFERVRVRSTMARPTLLPHELLVYVVPGFAHRLLPARFDRGQPSADQYGDTAWEGALTGAEVYIRGLPPKTVAKYVFHEALHAKTHLSNAALHKRNGLARVPMDHAAARLSRENIALMAKHLRRPHPAWTGGFDLVGGPKP